MRKTLSFCAALISIATTGAWAAESDGNPAPATETAAPTEGPPPAQVAPTPEVKPAEIPAEPVKLDPVVDSAATPSSPVPYTGWGRGLRPPIYVNLMMFAGVMGEDGDNRLTTRDSKLLEGAGGMFRVGAVINRHHRLGGRMQSFVRPTKKILPDPSTADTTTDGWGAVTFSYAGPEYLYTSDLGIYGGVSIGAGAAVSTRHIRQADSDDENHRERSSVGVAGVLSVGYEWRVTKWFALSAEFFGTLYHGVDDNENTMNGSLFGAAMGIGF
jgi:hypothetical protein